MRLTLLCLYCCSLWACNGNPRTPSESEPPQSSQIYGYLVRMSFVGASGGLILDDGKTFSFDAELGVERGALSAAELQALYDAVDDADFFDLPAKLHRDGVADGSEIELVVACASRAHRSTNYMDPSQDYADARAAIAKAAPAPRETERCEAAEVLQPAVRQLAEQMPPSPKRDAVRQWLDAAQALLDQHAGFREKRTTTCVVP